MHLLVKDILERYCHLSAKQYWQIGDKSQALEGTKKKRRRNKLAGKDLNTS